MLLLVSGAVLLLCAALFARAAMQSELDVGRGLSIVLLLLCGATGALCVLIGAFVLVLRVK